MVVGGGGSEASSTTNDALGAPTVEKVSAAKESVSAPRDPELKSSDPQASNPVPVDAEKSPDSVDAEGEDLVTPQSLGAIFF